MILVCINFKNKLKYYMIKNSPNSFKKVFKSFFTFFFLILIASCSSSKIQTKKNETSKNNVATTSGKNYKKNVIASYYHNKFNGRKTASGETFSNTKLTAAHKTLSFGTTVKVTNIVNNKSVIVKINDRGPFTKGREIDLSKKAFDEISDKSTHGELKVNIEIL